MISVNNLKGFSNIAINLIRIKNWKTFKLTFNWKRGNEIGRERLGMAILSKPWKNTIDKEKLRLGKMVQATQFDVFLPIQWNLPSHYAHYFVSYFQWMSLTRSIVLIEILERESVEEFLYIVLLEWIIYTSSLYRGISEMCCLHKENNNNVNEVKYQSEYILSIN